MECDSPSTTAQKKSHNQIMKRHLEYEYSVKEDIKINNIVIGEDQETLIQDLKHLKKACTASIKEVFCDGIGHK